MERPSYLKQRKSISIKEHKKILKDLAQKHSEEMENIREESLELIKQRVSQVRKIGNLQLKKEEKKNQRLKEQLQELEKQMIEVRRSLHLMKLNQEIAQKELETRTKEDQLYIGQEEILNFNMKLQERQLVIAQLEKKVLNLQQTILSYKQQNFKTDSLKYQLKEANKSYEKLETEYNELIKHLGKIREQNDLETQQKQNIQIRRLKKENQKLKKKIKENNLLEDTTKIKASNKAQISQAEQIRRLKQRIQVLVEKYLKIIKKMQQQIKDLKIQTHSQLQNLQAQISQISSLVIQSTSSKPANFSKPRPKKQKLKQK